MIGWVATLAACVVLLVEMGTLVPLALWFFAIACVFFWQQFGGSR